MAKKVLPRVQAMVLCDGLKESDEEPDDFTLKGVRSVVEASSFPALCPRLFAYIQMTGHAGEAYCHVEIERVETSDLIYHSSAKTVRFVGPTMVIPVHFSCQ